MILHHVAALARSAAVSVDEAVQALGSHEWHIVVAEERPRTAVGTGVDAAIRAVRRVIPRA